MASPGTCRAATGTHVYHVGEPPDPRAIEVAAGRGVDIAGLRARQVSPDDFSAFDLILAADRRNLSDLAARKPAQAGAEMALLLPWCGLRQAEVPDPYYGSRRDFVQVFDLLSDAMQGLRERL